jgi:hypothetical protein
MGRIKMQRLVLAGLVAGGMAACAKKSDSNTVSQSTPCGLDSLQTKTTCVWHVMPNGKRNLQCKGSGGGVIVNVDTSGVGEG